MQYSLKHCLAGEGNAEIDLYLSRGREFMIDFFEWLILVIRFTLPMLGILFGIFWAFSFIMSFIMGHDAGAGGPIFVFLLYFVPSINAGWRMHKNFNAIFGLNLLLGWTFIGWVVALVWSLTDHVYDKDRI